jgi:hypothetical protein
VTGVSETIEGVMESREKESRHSVSREAVLTFILNRLQQQGELCAQVLNHVKVHEIAPDELTEAGLSYEDVCAIDHALSVIEAN